VATTYTKTTTISTTTAPNSTVEIPCGEASLIALSIKGTFVGTLIFEATIDGINYYATGGIIATNVAFNTSQQTTTTIPGDFFIPVSAALSFRVRFSVYTSGAAVVVLRAEEATIPFNWSLVNTVLTPSATLGAFTGTHSLVSTATTNATSVKASSGTIGTITLTNASAAMKFFKLYNKASAPVVGTDTPVSIIGVPPTRTIVIPFEQGLRLTTGIAYALTGLMPIADTTALALNDMSVHINYI